MRSKYCSSSEAKSSNTDLTGKSIEIDKSDESVESNISHSGNTNEVNGLTLTSSTTNRTSEVVVLNEDNVFDGFIEPQENLQSEMDVS